VFLPYDSELGYSVVTDVCILRKSDNFCKDYAGWKSTILKVTL